MEIINKLTQLLTRDERLLVDGKLLKNKIVELAYKLDPQLISLLLSDSTFKSIFFAEVEGALVFDSEKFQLFVSNKEFLPNSFTTYKNKVGLLEGGKLLTQNSKVVLSYPYKDCILEGGQNREDLKRDEVFYNKILARDEIDRLVEPKVFENIKVMDKDGVHKCNSLVSDENLIIKGNNLLVLYSLKKRYAGKIKLIYIDPPYNTGGTGDTFAYNNSFKHSTWLTFMQNRLEVAKELLTKDGAIIIAIDEHEQPYLGVLLDEIFPEYENHCVTIVHNPRGIEGTNFSYTHEYAYFVIPKGKKTIKNREIEEENVAWSNLRNWGSESQRTDAKNCFYPILVDKTTNQVVDFGDVSAEDFHPTVNIHEGDFVYIYPIDKEGIERKWRYARQSVEEVKELLKVKITNGIYDIQIGKDFGMYRTVWVDKKYDANEYGTKLVKKLVPDSKFSFPKSLYNVYDCLYSIVSDDKEAIILDFHAGSGTTGHAVLELNKKDGGNRKFILVEQMDYIDSVTTKRIQKVIEMNGTGSFVRMDLKESNALFVTQIQSAQKMSKVLSKIKESGFLTHKVDASKLEEEEFSRLTIDEQRTFLLEVLDANHLYVNLSDIDDSHFAVEEEEKKLNKQFYSL